MPYDIGDDFNPLTVPAVMPKSVRRTNEDGTPTQAALDWEQSLQAWTRDNVANTNERLTLVKDAADGLEASVTTETNARIDGYEALAEQITTVEAIADGVSANGVIRMTAKAAPTGSVSSIGLFTNAGANYAGLEIFSNSGGASGIGFTANQFRFVDAGPAQTILSYSGGLFTVNANVQINGSLNIVGASVINGAMAPNACTNMGFGASVGTTTTVFINARAGAQVALLASFFGAAGIYFPLGTPQGQFSVTHDLTTTVGLINNNFEASGSGMTAGIAFLQTTLLVGHTPNVGSNRYDVFNTNGGGVGGVTLLALELAK